MKKCFILIVMLLICIPVAAFAAGFTTDVAGINEAAKSVLMLEVYQDDALIGTGSGFVVGNNRTLVTNHHVIEGGNAIIGYSDDGYSYLLTKVFAANEEQDLAILGFMSPTNLEPLALSTDNVLRAEPVVAIGSPQGMLNTVSMGNVSGFITIDNVDHIQFTAPISNGSSGGALFNDHGEVIGVTTSAIAPNGNVVQNLNFAVNAATVIDLLNSFSESDAVSLSDYSKGVLPGPTPEPTPEPTPTPVPTPKPTATPVPELGIRDVSMVYNGDGTATFSWYDDINKGESTYHIAIDNARWTGNVQFRKVIVQPTSNGYSEATVEFKVYCGDSINFAISRDRMDAQNTVLSEEISENSGIYVQEPTHEMLTMYEALEIGSKGEHVKAFQEKLIEYGYLSGTADGIYGKQTASAVKAFNMQNISGTPDIATSKTQAYLYEGNPKVMRYCVGIKSISKDTSHVLNDYKLEICNLSGKTIDKIYLCESGITLNNGDYYDNTQEIDFQGFTNGKTKYIEVSSRVTHPKRIRFAKIVFTDDSIYHPLEDNWYALP